MSTTKAHQAGVIEGTRRRDAAQKLLDTYRNVSILAARRILLEVALDRGTCSIDDVRERLELPPGQTNLGKFFGPFLKSGALAFLRYVPSRRPENHARLVMLLSLANADLARQWLRENRPPEPPPTKKAKQCHLPGLEAG